MPISDHIRRFQPPFVKVLEHAFERKMRRWSTRGKQMKIRQVFIFTCHVDRLLVCRGLMAFRNTLVDLLAHKWNKTKEIRKDTAERIQLLTTNATDVKTEINKSSSHTRILKARRVLMRYEKGRVKYTKTKEWTNDFVEIGNVKFPKSKKGEKSEILQKSRPLARIFVGQMEL